MHSFQWKPSPNTTISEAFTLEQHHCQRRLSDVRNSKIPYGKLELSTEEKVLLLFYDIETTGLNTSKCAMTQFAVQCFVYNCKNHQYLPCYTYSSYVHTTEHITPFITSLTGITQEDVNDAPSFEVIVQDIHQSIDTICQTHQITHCFWIAHNGFRFDQPLLSRYLLDHRGQTQYLQSMGNLRRCGLIDVFKNCKKTCLYSPTSSHASNATSSLSFKYRLASASKVPTTIGTSVPTHWVRRVTMSSVASRLNVTSMIRWEGTPLRSKQRMRPNSVVVFAQPAPARIHKC